VKVGTPWLSAGKLHKANNERQMSLRVHRFLQEVRTCRRNGQAAEVAEGDNAFSRRAWSESRKSDQPRNLYPSLHIKRRIKSRFVGHVVRVEEEWIQFLSAWATVGLSLTELVNCLAGWVVMKTSSSKIVTSHFHNSASAQITKCNLYSKHHHNNNV
jgi:hypothetical protein